MKLIKVFIVGMLILTIMLGGCGSLFAEPTIPNASELEEQNSVETTMADPVISCQYLPKKLEHTENLPVLKWVCLTERVYGGGTRTWNETAAVELNQVLADKNMPFRVQFVLFTMDQWLMNSNWLSRPEVREELKSADLIYGMMTSSDMQEYLLPITDYATGAAEPSLKNAVAHKYNWYVGSVGDQIFGIPTFANQAQAGGWVVSEEFLTRCNISKNSFNAAFWEMDELFEKIYYQNEQKPFLYIADDAVTKISNSSTGALDSCFPSALYDVISPVCAGVGSCFIVNYTLDQPTIGNSLELEYAINMQKAILRYKNAGYLAVDMPRAQLRYGTVFGESIYTDAAGAVVIPNTPTIFHATSAGGSVSGISANTQHKEEALSLFNLIAEDEEFRMQLFYGKEGRDYTITDGYYEIKIYEDGSSYSMDFLSPLSYFTGLTSNRMAANFLSPGTENWSLFTYDGKDLLETYQEVLDNSLLSYPIIFDYSGFERELKAMEEICEKYFPEYSKMTEEQYKQMLQELQNAGSKKILDALQQQLDQWLSENPDWQ